MAVSPLAPGEVHVWRINDLPERGAVRAVLRRYTAAPLEFATTQLGKPYLPDVPELRFSLSHSGGIALVAVAWGVDVGVDIERLRPLPDCLAVAAHFLPPADAAMLAEVPADAREREFFRLWTRFEAMLKARGVGLHGAGAPVAGDWTVEEIEAGPGFAAAAAAMRPGMRMVLGADD